MAISGIIGWIGLLIPHAARLLVGPEFARLLPLSLVLGACYLLAVDTLARTMASIEIPPGVLTALIGTPLFLWLLAVTHSREKARRDVDPHTARGARPRLRPPGRTLGRDLDLDVQAGEVLCVLGPNGGGKTTLFRTLLGLLPAHGGAISLGGTSLAILLTPPARAKRMAYVPQAGNSYFAFTVRDVVLMGRTAHLGLFAAPGAKDFAAADAALEELRIAPPRRQGVHANQRRRTPARAHRPRARAGVAAADHGRTHREPRFRQPGADPQ